MQGQTVGGGCWVTLSSSEKVDRVQPELGRTPACGVSPIVLSCVCRATALSLFTHSSPLSPSSGLSVPPPTLPQHPVFSASPSPHGLQAPPARSLVFLGQLSSRSPSPPSLWERWGGGQGVSSWGAEVHVCGQEGKSG